MVFLLVNAESEIYPWFSRKLRSKSPREDRTAPQCLTLQLSVNAWATDVYVDTKIGKGSTVLIFDRYFLESQTFIFFLLSPVTFCDKEKCLVQGWIKSY